MKTGEKNCCSQKNIKKNQQRFPPISRRRDEEVFASGVTGPAVTATDWASREEGGTSGGVQTPQIRRVDGGRPFKILKYRSCFTSYQTNWESERAFLTLYVHIFGTKAPYNQHGQRRGIRSCEAARLGRRWNEPAPSLRAQQPRRSDRSRGAHEDTHTHPQGNIRVISIFDACSPICFFFRPVFALSPFPQMPGIALRFPTGRSLSHLARKPGLSFKLPFPSVACPGPFASCYVRQIAMPAKKSRFCGQPAPPGLPRMVPPKASRLDIAEPPRHGRGAQ